MQQVELPTRQDFQKLLDYIERLEVKVERLEAKIEPPEKIFKASQLQKWLNISEHTLNKWILEGLPVTIVRGTRRFRFSRVARFLDEREITYTMENLEDQVYRNRNV